LGIKKKRGKMYRDLGNKNDGKIFKTLGIGEVEKIVGIEEIIENVLRTFFLIVKMKDVRKRSPHHYCCLMHGWHYISMHNSLNIF
jgi:hypothetical protein